MATNCGPCVQLVTASAVMASLSTIAVALRFISRRVTKLPILLDDWLILVALPFSWVECFLNIQGVFNNNLGNHFAGDWTQLQRGLYETWWFQICYCFAVVLPKFSILALYWRVFGINSFKWPLISTAVVTLAYLIGTIFAAIFACIPVNAFWDIALQIGAKCVNSVNFYIAQASINIAIDILLLLLPIIPIRKLQISRPQKIAVVGIFSLGIFVTICSALRLNALIGMLKDQNFDPDFQFEPGALWSAIETNLSIVCVCLPSMRPLLRVMLSGSFREALSRSGGSNSNHGQSRAFTPGFTSCFSGRGRAPWRPLPPDHRNEALSGNPTRALSESPTSRSEFLNYKASETTTVIELSPRVALAPGRQQRPGAPHRKS